MKEPGNIKLIFANAEKEEKNKSQVALFVIWLFSVLAMVFIFLDNIDFVKMPVSQSTGTIKKQQLPVDGAAAGESFVMVQYNKKLILTKYSALSIQSEEDSILQENLPVINENKPVVIKRPRNRLQKETGDFFSNSVPK